DLEDLLDFVRRTKRDIVRGNQAPVRTPGPVIPPPPQTLWERLGGEDGARKIVDDFLDPAMKDPKVDFFRGGKHKMNAVQIKAMKGKFVDLISHHGQGPRKYEGPTMKEIHRLMGIKDAEFDALGDHLKKALKKNKVGAEDMESMLSAMELKRNDIVT